MIKINKDFNDIPPSLLSDNTHKRRGDLIERACYTHAEPYNKCYKEDDIKDKLAFIYHRKCVYCEQYIEQFHVEHYRPKSIYYWLAYSWDNLLLVCPVCNQSKTDKFPIIGTDQRVPTIQYEDTPDNRLLFHNLSDFLNQKEQPSLVNPEKEDPHGYIQFLNDGTIASDDTRYVCTIEICRLNRPSLVTERKLILDELARKIRAEIGSTKKISRQRDRLGTCVRNYREENRIPSTPFLGFRRFAMRHLLRSLIKGIFPRDGGAA